MRKLLGLFSICALVGVAAGVNGAGATPPSGQSSEKEYGRAQQIANGTVVASSGHDVLSTTYTVAPGGDTGWRTGPGTTALIVTKGALKIEQAEGCASRDLPAGKALVLPPGQFRLKNAGQEPVELLANLTGLSNGGGSPLDGPTDPAPACAGFAAAAAATGISASNSFRGDISPYFRQAHAGHGAGDAYPGSASRELSVEAGKDAFMGTLTLQPGFRGVPRRRRLDPPGAPPPRRRPGQRTGGDHVVRFQHEARRTRTCLQQPTRPLRLLPGAPVGVPDAAPVANRKDFDA
jgi:quercetin dioxygenase-like cupin family protein